MKSEIMNRSVDMDLEESGIFRLGSGNKVEIRTQYLKNVTPSRVAEVPSRTVTVHTLLDLREYRQENTQ
jgi:hypothetical protein